METNLDDLTEPLNPVDPNQAARINIVETDVSQENTFIHLNQIGQRSLIQFQIHTYRNLFLWSCLFSVPVVIFALVLPMLPPYGEWLDYWIHNSLTVGMLLKWIFCTPVQFIIGRRFYEESYSALRQKSANMAVPIALGTNAAYFYSVYIVMTALTSRFPSFKGQDFFETSSMLISFILLGEFLEAIVKGAASDGLIKLADLAPDTACLLTMDDSGAIVSEMDINTQLLRRNDIIRISPGAKIPVDGIVIHGHSHVNESTITGESRSIVKAPGDKVVGGTVNERGTFIVKVTHVGVDTALSQIVQLMESTRLSREPVQKFADHFSKCCIPIVVAVATLTWLAWLICGSAGKYPKHWIPKGMDEFEFALQFAISVLVVACPFALDSQTQTVVLVASGKAASLGVLFKRANALECACQVDTVVFDEPGTLTLGRPEVVSVVLLNKFSMLTLCDMTIAIESNREHPLGKAIVEHAKKMQESFGKTSGRQRRRQMENFEEFPEGGVGGKVDNAFVLVGSRKFMCTQNIHFGSEVDQYTVENKSLPPQSYIFVAIDGVVAGAFGVVDPPKPGAKAVIAYLHSKDISTMMVTGDDENTAAIIANELGIKNVLSEIDPFEKASKINALKIKGKIVAVVGDGVKDAPALAAANVGIAIGAGADIAIGAADIVLMRSNIEDVVTAIDISRKTVCWIWLSYVWAVVYNMIAVVLATGILYPIIAGIRLSPWLAGAIRVLSSLGAFYFYLIFKA